MEYTRNRGENNVEGVGFDEKTTAEGPETNESEERRNNESSGDAFLAIENRPLRRHWGC